MLKNKLITKPVLQLYDPKLPLHVFCDASLKAIGAILKQPDNSGTLHPVSFHSRILREYEKKYCITESECLAIIDALDKFYYYLHRKKFIIHSDHTALVLLKNVKNLRGRLFRWSLKLSMFDYEVKYLKGTNNVEADMLSRHPIAQYIQHSVHLLELSEIKIHQNLDNVNDPKYKRVDDVFVIKKKNLFKIVAPFSLRRKILQNAHEQFGHPEGKGKKRFGLLQTVPPTDQTFEYISVDTLSVGGFNYYNSTKKILHLIIDHATRYVWVFASKSETTETFANCSKQLFQIQIPSKLLTDRNGAFTSSRFKHFLRNYNVKQLLTTSHHPQTNGKCERVNQSIVTKLRCKVNSSPTKIPWTKILEQVINEYNLTPHSVTKFPPAYLLFGTLPYTPPLAQNQVYPPVEEARKLAKENTIKYHEKNKIKYDARFIDSPFVNRVTS
ncbi:transposon Tf2-9 polyprotein [Trichonephila clavipes]|nr:transposon Tf2-9 polyprotein [Trichonephila clavipes]